MVKNPLLALIFCFGILTVTSAFSLRETNTEQREHGKNCTTVGLSKLKNLRVEVSNNTQNAPPTNQPPLVESQSPESENVTEIQTSTSGSTSASISTTEAVTMSPTPTTTSIPTSDPTAPSSTPDKFVYILHLIANGQCNCGSSNGNHPFDRPHRKPIGRPHGRPHGRPQHGPHGGPHGGPHHHRPHFGSPFFGKSLFDNDEFDEIDIHPAIFERPPIFDIIDSDDLEFEAFGLNEEDDFKSNPERKTVPK